MLLDAASRRIWRNIPAANSGQFLVYNAAMDSREVMWRLRQDGWYVDRINGSHHQLKHPTKPGTTTVQHPLKDIAPGVLRNIERQSSVSRRQ